MPIFLDPHRTHRAILSADKDKPNPPTFLFKPATMRQQQEAIELATATGKSQLEKVQAILAQRVTGWENFDGEFSADRLWDLTFDEADELLRLTQTAGEDLGN